MEAMRVSAGFFNSAVYLAAYCLESLELLVSFVDSDNFTTFQLIILLINSVSVALKTQMDSALEEEFGVEQEGCCRVINKKAIKMSCTTIVNMAMISASGQCSICLQEFEEGQNGKVLL